VSVAGVSYYYTRDHLGSIRELTDGTGAVRARYDYTPWGERTKLAGDMDSDFGFTGHYQHAASELGVAPYRFYSAESGRWLNRDPIGESGGLNLYGYVGNGPVSRMDRLGLKPGDPFRTRDAAARDAINFYCGSSLSENREYAGWIHQTGPDRFVAESGVPLARDGGEFGPKPPDAAAWYHTHGGLTGDAQPEYFSTQDMDTSDNADVPGYVGTPYGAFGRYTPSSMGLDPKTGRPRFPRMGKTEYMQNSGQWGCDRAGGIDRSGRKKVFPY
jgi:RHS repeat-associated protein